MFEDKASRGFFLVFDVFSCENVELNLFEVGGGDSDA